MNMQDVAIRRFTATGEDIFNDETGDKDTFATVRGRLFLEGTDSGENTQEGQLGRVEGYVICRKRDNSTDQWSFVQTITREDDLLIDSVTYRIVGAIPVKSVSQAGNHHYRFDIEDTR